MNPKIKPTKKKYYTCSICQRAYTSLEAMFDCEDRHYSAASDDSEETQNEDNEQNDENS